ncbi:MAG: hypothetical protein JW747_07900, partial [Candidatus Aminicenantes bacterium]|nr:hypothetical protein [Candidatus Aminicenantes bacterium]
EKNRFEEHFFNCRSCFEELKAREEVVQVIKDRSDEIFARARPAGSEKASGLGPGRAWRFKPWWAAAASAAVVVLVLVLAGLRRPNVPPVFTLGDDEAIRGETLELLSPRDEIEPVPRFFEWTPLSRKARYVLSLSGRELIWSGETDENRLDLPANIQERLKPGRTYSWEVKAYSPPGTLITVSNKAEFRIRKD